jgi:hypothetical protein
MAERPGAMDDERVGDVIDEDITGVDEDEDFDDDELDEDEDEVEEE